LLQVAQHLTEVEWFGGADRRAMLDALQGKASKRKTWLFFFACCRRHWRWFTDAKSRERIQAAERLVDQGDVPSGFSLLDCSLRGQRIFAVEWRPNAPPVDWGPEGLRAVGDMFKFRRGDSRREDVAQCDLLRELFGNPFQPTGLDRSLRTLDTEALARTAYEHRSYTLGDS
jgi:hypothetical protein